MAKSVKDKEISKSLLDRVNEIDAQALGKGTPIAGNLWALAQRCMWEKGLAVIEAYPDIAEKISEPDQGGRPKKGEARSVSIRKVADDLGRGGGAVRRWLKLALAFPTEGKVVAYIKDGKAAAAEKWQRKQIASDGEREDPKPNKQKKMEDNTLAAVRARWDADGEVDADDIEYLISAIENLRTGLQNALTALLDDAPDKALGALQKTLEGPAGSGVGFDPSAEEVVGEAEEIEDELEAVKAE